MLDAVVFICISVRFFGPDIYALMFGDDGAGIALGTSSKASFLRPLDDGPPNRQRSAIFQLEYK